MNTAHLYRDVSDAGWRGRVLLYFLDAPIEYRTSDNQLKHTNYILVSAAPPPFDSSEPETYIFPATGGGEVLDWAELPGSYRGGADHEEALRRAEIAIGPPVSQEPI